MPRIQWIRPQRVTELLRELRAGQRIVLPGISQQRRRVATPVSDRRFVYCGVVELSVRGELKIADCIEVSSTPNLFFTTEGEVIAPQPLEARTVWAQPREVTYDCVVPTATVAKLFSQAQLRNLYTGILKNTICA